MATRRVTKDEPVANSQRRRRRATTPEARENQLIALAYDLAEQRLRRGTASSQEVTLFLKMGSSRERLEQERLENENQLTQAKIEMLASQHRIEELYGEALRAMSSYRGEPPIELEPDFND